MAHIFDDVDAWSMASIVAVGMVVSWLAGRSIGHRLRLETEGKAAVSKFLDASLAVLGLLLAFTFSTALVKHDQRRLMVVADSNAIGDFYTCASLLKEPLRTRLRRVIHDYAALRIDLSKRAYNRTLSKKHLSNSSRCTIRWWSSSLRRWRMAHL